MIGKHRSQLIQVDRFHSKQCDEEEAKEGESGPMPRQVRSQGSLNSANLIHEEVGAKSVGIPSSPPLSESCQIPSQSKLALSSSKFCPCTLRLNRPQLRKVVCAKSSKPSLKKPETDAIFENIQAKDACGESDKCYPFSPPIENITSEGERYYPYRLEALILSE